MTDARALLAAIYESPDDDGPRSVYADYLIERGDPRGELIASQLATSRAKPGQRQRERELLAAHAEEWVAPLGVEPHAVKFERGFPAIVETRTINQDPAWSTVHTCPVPPRDNGCHVRGLRTVTAASTEDIEALAHVTTPLAIETLRWGEPYDMGDHRCAVTTTRAAIASLAARRFKRLDLAPSIVGNVISPRDVEWAFPIASELALPTQIGMLAYWVGAPLVRLELAIPENPPPRDWRLEVTVTLDAERNLTAVTKRSARHAIFTLTDAIGPGIRSVRVAIPTQADMDGTLQARERLEAKARSLGIPCTIERAAR